MYQLDSSSEYDYDLRQQRYSSWSFVWFSLGNSHSLAFLACTLSDPVRRRPSLILMRPSTMTCWYWLGMALGLPSCISNMLMILLWVLISFGMLWPVYRVLCREDPLLDTPSNSTLVPGIQFWVVNMNTITGIVATGLSSLGGTGIIGLYVVIIVTLSSYINSFLIPATEKILYGISCGV